MLVELCVWIFGTGVFLCQRRIAFWNSTNKIVHDKDRICDANFWHSKEVDFEENSSLNVHQHAEENSSLSQKKIVSSHNSQDILGFLEFVAICQLTDWDQLRMSKCYGCSPGNCKHTKRSREKGASEISRILSWYSFPFSFTTNNVHCYIP